MPDYFVRVLRVAYAALLRPCVACRVCVACCVWAIVFYRQGWRSVYWGMPGDSSGIGARAVRLSCVIE